MLMLNIDQFLQIVFLEIRRVDPTDRKLKPVSLFDFWIERKGLIMTDQDRKVLAYHEAGHGILANKLPNSDPLHKITIVPRGMALGQTQQIALSDHHAYSKQYLLSKMIVLMGGRAAEELIFKQQTTGAQGDLLTATRIATDMVCKWGMSKTLGPQAFTVERGGFIEGISGRLPMGHDTEKCIDREVNELLTNCFNQAMQMLKEERSLLDNLAEILLQVETLDGEEFDIIVDCSVKKDEAAADHMEVANCSTCNAKENCSHAIGVNDEITA
jgi:cell division protease FtsH